MSKPQQFYFLQAIISTIVITREKWQGRWGNIWQENVAIFQKQTPSVCCFLQYWCGNALHENVIAFQPVLKVCVGGRVGCENVSGNWEHNKQWVGQGRSGGHIREGRTGTNLSLTLFGNLRRDTVTITFSWFIAQDSAFNQEKRSHVMRIDNWSRKPRFSSIVQSAPKKTFSTSCGSSLISWSFHLNSCINLTDFNIVSL